MTHSARQVEGAGCGLDGPCRPMSHPALPRREPPMRDPGSSFLRMSTLLLFYPILSLSNTQFRHLCIILSPRFCEPLYLTSLPGVPPDGVLQAAFILAPAAALIGASCFPRASHLDSVSGLGFSWEAPHCCFTMCWLSGTIHLPPLRIES